MEAFIVAVSPFVLNVVMSWFKRLAGNLSTTGKRGFLAILALIGALAYNRLTGTPLQMDSITSLTSIVVEGFVGFLLAHGSYTLFWKK